MRILSGQVEAGWVADYCVICRDVQAHRVLRNSYRGHVDLTSECRGCGTRYSTEAERYLSLVPDRPDDLSELLQRTNPRLPLAIDGRVRGERLAVTGGLDLSGRADALREPFAVLGYLAFGLNKFPCASFITLTFVLSILQLAVIVVIDAFGIRMKAGLETAVVLLNLPVAIAGGLAMAFVLRGWRARRRFFRQIEPRVAVALRPLRPESEELESLRAWMLSSGKPMAHMLDPGRLLERIRVLRDKSLFNVEALGLEPLAQQMREDLARRAADDDHASAYE